MSIGHCPICGAPGKNREKRPGGNDTCEEGCTYPSRNAIFLKVGTKVTVRKGTTPLRNMEGMAYPISSITEDKNYIVNSVLFTEKQLDVIIDEENNQVV